MATVIVLGAMILIIATVIVSRSITTYGQTSLDKSYEHSLQAAESGVADALNRLAVSSAYFTVNPGTDLSSKAAIIEAAEKLAQSPSQIRSTPTGEYVIVKKNNSDVFYAVGASPSWSEIAGRRLRVVEVEFGETAYSGSCWPEAAIIGKGLIETGDATIQTAPSHLHAAHAIGNFNLKGNSSLSIDGDVRVAGVIYNTPPEAVYGEMEENAQPLDFPTAGEITSWENELKTEAMAGGTIPSIDLSGPMTINAPVFVNGSIHLHSGARLTINGPGTVYVNGYFEMGGDSEVTNGSLLAVRDFFKQGGGTSYILGGDPTEAGLISFYTNTDAIQFEGSAAGTQGIIYAARGGIKLTGSAALNGAAIAGGEGTNGQIKFGGGTTMTYPAGLVQSVTWLPEITGGAGSPCSSGGASEKTALPDSAIISQGEIKLSGTISSVPAGSHSAHVYSNTKVDGGYVDGDIYSAGSISSTAYGNTYPNSDPLPFPSETEIAELEASLIADAQTGPTTSGDISPGGDLTIDAPAYIDGNMKASGVTITINGPGTVYVTGKLEASGGGRYVNNGGATLASGTQIVLSGGSLYQVQGDPTQAAIISFGTSGNNAMVLSGDSTGNANGIAYAPRGGITLSGGSNWHGALVAGGAPGSAKVTLSGGSGVQMTVGLISGSPLFNGGGDDGGSGAGTLSIVRMREL